MQITGAKRNDSLNVFGHTALAAEGHGVYSYGTGTPRGSDTLEYITSQSNNRDQIITIIPTTAEQDAAALSFFNNTPPDSITFINNCAAITKDALFAASIETRADIFPISLARETMKIPGAQNFYIKQGNSLPPELAKIIKEKLGLRLTSAIMDD